MTFFDNVCYLLSDRIINLDETGIPTVLPTQKVLAEKKLKPSWTNDIGLVTLYGVVTATGATLPPCTFSPEFTIQIIFK